MRILFVHQNFPGQFKHLAASLVQRGHEVTALSMRDKTPDRWEGVRIVVYRAARASSTQIHPWLADFETKAIRGEAAFHAASQLKAQGFEPDVIVAHPGWGESLFLKDVWPNARLGMYCEFFYHAHGADLNFDPEFPGADDTANCQMRLKNINNLLHFEVADAGLAPTQWQASTFPEPFRSRIAVAHDGIDTQALRPDAGVQLSLNSQPALTRADEVVTFVSRNLEPYRGYHYFMRALPPLLRLRPNARVLIVGADGAGYGRCPPQGTTWREMFLAEVAPRMSQAERSRIYFLGAVPHAQYLSVLQLSSVHVYLTYPFVLSWSLLEAMSVGCAIVASDTPPLHEAIRHGETGRLVSFFDALRLADEIANLLQSPTERSRLGANARAEVISRFDLKTICLPRQIEWVEGLASRS